MTKIRILHRFGAFGCPLEQASGTRSTTGRYVLSVVGTVSTPSLIWPTSVERPSPVLRVGGPRPSELRAGLVRVRGDQASTQARWWARSGTRAFAAPKRLRPRRRVERVPTPLNTYTGGEGSGEEEVRARFPVPVGSANRISSALPRRRPIAAGPALNPSKEPALSLSKEPALSLSKGRRTLSAVLGAGLLLGMASGAPTNEMHLNFGLYSSKKPSEMIQIYRPLLDAVEARLSRSLHKSVFIHSRVVKTYEEGIEALVTGQWDFSQVGPVSYVQAKAKNPKLRIVAVEGARGGKTVNGIICVLSNSSIRTVAQLKGRSFAFGDQFSTTGRYNSQLFLLDQGITAKDLKKFEYLERHDRVGAAVAAGEYDAGALNERTFKKLNEKGANLRALAQFPIAGRPWVACSQVPVEIIEALRQALLAMKDEKALAALGEEGLVFLSGEDSDYASTRVAVDRNDRFFH